MATTYELGSWARPSTGEVFDGVMELHNGVQQVLHVLRDDVRGFEALAAFKDGQQCGRFIDYSRVVSSAAQLVPL